MNDKFRSQGKVYLNGTVVQYAVPPSLSNDQMERRNKKAKETRERKRAEGLSDRSFKIKFKQRMKIYDAITVQSAQAAADPNLHHCFLTATFRAGSVPPNPNRVFGAFLDKIKKAGFKNYVWTRELTRQGTVHYHFTTVGKKKPVNSVQGWSINKCWCDSRNDYSGNAIRSTTVYICSNSACSRRHFYPIPKCIDCRSPTRKVNQMAIKDLHAARSYVAKYISKANEAEQDAIPGRIYAITDDLQRKPPLTVADALQYAYSNLSSKDVRRFDYATIGEVSTKYCQFVYDMCLEEMEQDRLESEWRLQKAKNNRKTQISLKF